MTDSAAPLKILFITEDDPLYVIQFFDVFFKEYPKDELEIIGVTVDRAFHEPLSKTAKRMWNFFGPVDFVRMGMRFAATKAGGRSIAGLAEASGLTLVPATSVNSPEYIERAKELAPDVIVSVAAPEIFKEDILGVPRLGCLNIHSGRLPIYRGMMPNFWQMRHGEENAVVTIHEMVPKLDAGGVVATFEFPIKPKDSLDRLIRGTKQEGARLMIDALRRLRRGELESTPLDMSDKKYFSFPKPDDVKAFRARGHRLL
jgi:methionyl-tRNA formyltransferase